MRNKTTIEKTGMKQWYEELFIDYAESYDKEPFTKGTLGEVDFIEVEIEYNKSKRILDIGCGTGRHAIELAKRGYSVTGIDLSESQLKQAQKKAQEEQVGVNFVKKDARDFHFSNSFDLAMLICEGAFPLMEGAARYYNPSEIHWYLESLEFKKIDIYGCVLGAFSRKKQLTADDFEMLVIAEK